MKDGEWLKFFEEKIQMRHYYGNCNNKVITTTARLEPVMLWIDVLALNQLSYLNLINLVGGLSIYTNYRIFCFSAVSQVRKSEAIQPV